MNITANQIALKKRVGTLHGRPVMQLTTKGGLVMIVCQKNEGENFIASAGPHPAIAKYIAEKKEPDIVFSELSKSDYVDEASILSVYDKYVALTDQLNGLMANG